MTIVAASAREILSTLWRAGQYAYLWTDNGKRSRWFKINEPSSIPAEWINSNVYFSIHPCSAIPTTNSRGEQVDASQVRSQIRLISAINCVFGEFDAKDEVNTKEYAPFLADDYDDLADITKKTAVKTAKEQAVVSDLDKYKARAFARIDKAPFPPTLIIDSGGGYHAYWMFTEPVTVTDANRTHIQAVQAAWVDLIGCDPVSKDLARVLRVPGTKNVKPQYAPNFPLVSVIKYAPEQACTFEQIEVLTSLDDLTVAAKQAQRKTKESNQDKPTDDVISEFNRTHHIVDMLVAQGYTLGWERPNVARLGRPGRDKGQTSVIVFKDGEKEMSYHHSSSDPLYTIGHCLDAFDIYTKTEHKGDAKAAYSAAKREQGKWTESRTSKRQALDPQTGEILPLESVKPTAYTNGNGSHNHTEQAAASGYAKLEAPQAQADTDFMLKEGAHDEGNARCVHRLYDGKFLYNSSFGWLEHTGTHWIIEEAESAVERAITETLIARANASLRSGAPDSDLIKRCIPNAGKVQGAKAQLKSLVSVGTHEFDSEPDLLNCKNGVVDLRTGEITPHKPSQRFMHCTAIDYDPNADQDTWVNWLTEAVGAEVENWLQIAVGYSLTGHTREEIMFYLFGPPRSGKGTFTETIMDVLGTPLSGVVGFHTLTAPSEADTQNFNLAPLHNARFIAASESNQYERFNEAKVKLVTGGDKIQCSFKHKTPFSYRPKYKIWLSSNQPVNADPDDDAVWGRLRVVKFPHSYLGNENKSLKQQMRTPAVMRGILAWAVLGAIRWYQLGNSGLPELQSSMAEKKEHREALDNVQSWLSECAELADNGFTANADLYLSYERWCKNNGVEPKKQKGLSQSLIRKGLKDDRTTTKDRKTVRGFKGIALK